MTYEEYVELTLPGSWTAQTAMVFLNAATRSVEITNGGRLVQVGTVAGFYVGVLANGTKVLSATIFTDMQLDHEAGATLTVEDTVIGDLTVTYRERTGLLPLFF